MSWRNKIRSSILRRAQGSVETVLDAVNDFQDKGGVARLLGDATGRGVVVQHSGRKTLRQYYENLETPFGADMASVKSNYRRLMRKYHPDRHGDDPEREALATALSQELTQAYKAIQEHHKRLGRK